MPTRLRSTVLTGTLVVAMAAMAAPGVAQPGPPTPPNPEGLSAQITRTTHGIPHIVADDYESLGFGHGYAAAEDNICNLADTLVTGRGERSRYFGPDARYSDEVTLSATNLQADTLFTNIRDRGVVEDLLADTEHGPGEETRAMVEGYTAGVNQYLADIGGAEGIEDPTCAGGDWVQPGEPLDLWHGIYAANLLASAGVFVPEIVEASPPTIDDPGLPDLGLGVGAAGFAPVPDELPSEEELRERLGMAGNGFGSNGTALGGAATDTGKGMVLGNPHFPWKGRYRFSQAHLTIPGEYDVAGGMLLGSPVVNIGWNDDVAWTHTVSTAYRFTPYEYKALSYEGLPTHYLTTDGGVKELDRQVVTVTVTDEDGTLTEVEQDLYRTDEGYVIDAPELLMGWTPVSFFALREANAEHLMTLDVFHEMAKAGDVHELLDAHIETGGMPWVNTMAADRDGNALYADASVVPQVPDLMVAQCATPIGLALFAIAGLPGLDGTRASADCSWGEDEDAARPGIFGRDNLPHTVRDDWVINANDSHWLPNPDEPLEGFARIIGCEECERSLRTRMVYRYVLDRLDGSDGLGGEDVFTHEQLKAIQHENRVFAAELARENDDLQAVCAAAVGEDHEACQVLADQWDGRTNVDSVGAHLFREFWTRTPADRWNEEFDANRPVETPRDLREDDEDVIDAFRAAVGFLDDRDVALDTPLGDLQIAAFEHAPGLGDDDREPIGLGGGPGNTGNANMLSGPRAPADADELYHIEYGSSHMQAVAFTEHGVDAATMLTYGIPISDTHEEFAGQTEVFASGEWVDFPFTDEEIAAARQEAYVVSEDGKQPLPPTEPGPPQERPEQPETPADHRAERPERPERPGAPASEGQVAPSGQAAAAVPASTMADAAPTALLVLGVLLLALAAVGPRRTRARSGR